MALDQRGYEQATSAAQAVLKHDIPALIVDGRWGRFTDQAYSQSSGVTQLRAGAVVKAITGGEIAELREFRNAQRVVAPVAQPVAASSRDKWAAIFLNEVVPATIRMATVRGYRNPQLAVAQMRHESGNGRSVAAAFNWGGLKPSKGQKAGPAVSTGEVIGGKDVKIMASFAAFDNVEQFVTAYFDRLDRLWPRARDARTSAEWVAALNVGGKSMAYATARPAEYLAGLNRHLMA